MRSPSERFRSLRVVGGKLKKEGQDRQRLLATVMDDCCLCRVEATRGDMDGDDARREKRRRRGRLIQSTKPDVGGYDK